MSRSAVTPRATPATEADLLALPEGGRGYELIDGELVEKRPLRAGAEEAGFTPWHNLAQARTVVFTDPFGRRAGGGGRPGGSWILPEQHTRVGDDIVRPDVAGWRRERLPELPKGVAVLPLRPDWICEVVSPGHAADDLVRKRRRIALASSRPGLLAGSSRSTVRACFCCKREDIDAGRKASGDPWGCSPPALPSSVGGAWVRPRRAHLSSRCGSAFVSSVVGGLSG